MNESNIDKKFDEIVGAANNLKDGIDKYNHGYRYGNGSALRVLRPKTTQQVSEILRFCNEHKIAVVPQGGNTGLVGSSVTDASRTQIILSTELLNKDLFELNGSILTLGAGNVLGAVNEKLADKGLFLPIDIGSKDTCNIGGLISTNAAGTRAGRYGNAKSRTLEITVALADGSLQTIKTRDPDNALLLQDNSRIDFNNHFIGTQGVFGIIIAAKMQLEPTPTQQEAVILVPNTPKDINIIRQKFHLEFGDNFTAFEGMSDLALQAVARHIPNTRYLFEGDVDKKPQHNYSLLAEVSQINKDEDLQSKLEDVLASLMETGSVVTGLIGKSDLYWHHRHHISDAIAKEGSIIATDIAVKNPEDLAKFRIEMSAQLLKEHPHLLIAPFGHEMLGAMHFNVIWSKNHSKPIEPSDKREIQQKIYNKVVQEFGGTFSAEHGIGPYNQWAYDEYTSPEIKNKSKELKYKLDPKHILNPNFSYGW